MLPVHPNRTGTFVYRIRTDLAEPARPLHATHDMALCPPCRDCRSCPVCASEARRKEPFLEQHAWPFALPRCGRRTYTPQLSAYAGRSQDHRSRLPAEAVLGSECDGSSLDRIERVPWTRICDDRRLCQPRPAAVGRVNASRMYVIPPAQLMA